MLLFNPGIVLELIKHWSICWILNHMSFPTLYITGISNFVKLHTHTHIYVFMPMLILTPIGNLNSPLDVNDELRLISSPLFNCSQFGLYTHCGRRGIGFMWHSKLVICSDLGLLWQLFLFFMPRFLILHLTNSLACWRVDSLICSVLGYSFHH